MIAIGYFFVYMILTNHFLNKILICKYINKVVNLGYNYHVNVLISLILER